MNIPVYLGIRSAVAYLYTIILGIRCCHIVYDDYTSILGIHCAMLFIMKIPVYWACFVPLRTCIQLYWAYVVAYFYYEFTSIFGHTLCHVFFKSIPGIRCAILLFTYQYIRRMLCYLVFYFIYIYIIYLGIPLCHMLTHTNTTCTCT
jgi:hypothetical protein